MAGKSQGHTCNTLKEHTLQEIQKTLKNGKVIADDLQKGVDAGINVTKPTREIIFKQKMADIIKNNHVKSADAAEQPLMCQKELDIEYKTDSEAYKDKDFIYKANKCKVLTTTHNYCNKTT